MSDILIVNPLAILTGECGANARATGSVRVRGGRITEIGALSPEPGDRVVDATGCVLTPGLINTHHHLFQSVMKCAPQGMNEGLAAWLRLVPYALWERIDEDVLRVAARIGLAELALSGATTVCDHHYLWSESYDHDPGEVLFGAAAEFGLRFALARGGATRGRSFDDGRGAALPVETLDNFLGRTMALANRWHEAGDAPMRRVICAPTTPTFSLDPGELSEIAQAARARGLRLHSHLSENGDYAAMTLAQTGQRPVPWVAERGWLGEDVFFAHLVDCTHDEVTMLAQSGTAMAHCPQANARLGSGVAPAAALHGLSGTVSLAVDGAAANEAADMVQALYAAFCHQRAASGAQAVAAETVLHWATMGGARALGMPGLGRIAPGMAADLCLWDLSQPRFMGQIDAAIGPIVSGGAGALRHSFVAGRPLVVDGRLPDLDLGQLGRDAARVTARMAA